MIKCSFAGATGVRATNGRPTFRTAKGVSDKTIRNYHSHLHSLQKHLDFSAPLATLTKEDLDSMVISMRQSGLAHNSISSYLRVFRTFLNWARKAGYASR